MGSVLICLLFGIFLLGCLVIGGRSLQVGTVNNIPSNLSHKGSEAEISSPLLAAEVKIFDAPQKVLPKYPLLNAKHISAVYGNVEWFKLLIWTQYKIVFFRPLKDWQFGQFFIVRKWPSASIGHFPNSSYGFTKILYNWINQSPTTSFPSNFDSFHQYPRTFTVSEKIGLTPNNPDGQKQHSTLQSTNNDKPPCVFDEFPLYLYFLIVLLCLTCEYLGISLLNLRKHCFYRFFGRAFPFLSGLCGILSVGGAVALDDPLFWWAALGGHDPYGDGNCAKKQEQASHVNTVPQKYLLTSTNYWGTVIRIEDTQMANILAAEKQIAVISALAEGSGIRQIERMTGVNRNTIMNLGVRAPIAQDLRNLEPTEKT